MRQLLIDKATKDDSRVTIVTSNGNYDKIIKKKKIENYLHNILEHLEMSTAIFHGC